MRTSIVLVAGIVAGAVLGGAAVHRWSPGGEATVAPTAPLSAETGPGTAKTRGSVVPSPVSSSAPSSAPASQQSSPQSSLLSPAPPSSAVRDAGAASGDLRPAGQGRAVPTTPRYGPPAAAMRPPAESPDGRPGAIFRCRTPAGGTSYSNLPCAGGSVVEEANAVGGFDTRPSERMAELVASGRSADALPPRSRAAPGIAAVAAPPPTGACAAMRQQIEDLDASARQPGSARRLDEIRAVRQDIRTTMARDRC